VALTGTAISLELRIFRTTGIMGGFTTYSSFQLRDARARAAAGPRVRRGADQEANPPAERGNEAGLPGALPLDPGPEERGRQPEQHARQERLKRARPGGSRGTVLAPCPRPPVRGGPEDATWLST
jgi:hypothetical protein